VHARDLSYPPLARGLAPEPEERHRRLWLDALKLSLLFAIPGLISSTQTYMMYASEKPSMGISFRTAILWQLPPWQVWALATPVILALGRRFRLDRGSLPLSLGVHLLANAFFAVAHMAVFYITTILLLEKSWLRETSFFSALPLILLRNLHLELLTYWGVLAVTNALDYRRRYQHGKLVAAQLETKLAQAQLDALKMQLHPHFLFNTLHAIAVLVRKQDIQGAVRMIAGVSDLLRLALANTGRQHVPLSQEVDFVARYLEIERTRFADRLTVKTDLAPDTLELPVPNLILQPLVENAIKHGIAQRAAAGRVELTSRRKGDRLILTVRDDGPGLRVSGVDGAGVGLANVRGRLDQLYPDRHKFTVENHPDGGVLCTLEIPL
jgi:two-component system, LytTR family, sensor kinase